MGAYAWRDQRSVATALFEEGHRFSFLQAVRLLERLSTRQGQTAPGDGSDPAKEIVQFHKERGIEGIRYPARAATKRLSGELQAGCRVGAEP